MFTQIDNYINRIISLTAEELTLFHSVIVERKIKKKEFLLKEGEIGNFEAYVKKGCLKMYYLDEKDNESILMFAVEDWWVGDILSYAHKIPTSLNIEALEDSELLMINYEDKEMLYEKIPKLERMYRLMFQNAYGVLQFRLFSTISKPAKERYLDFLAKYPSIPQRVPQHQIAAYLGISPEFLSKIRANLAKIN